MSTLLLEGRDGHVYWKNVERIVSAVQQQKAVPDDLLHLFKERLKAGVANIISNTLSALHMLSLSTWCEARDQLASSKCMKHLDRMLAKPPIPGIESAVGQLLVDWSYLFGHEELGHKATAMLSSSRTKGLASLVQPSSVAVLYKEDKQLGLPQCSPLVRGLDFGIIFVDPLAGPSIPPNHAVADKLAASLLLAQLNPSSSSRARQESPLWAGPHLAGTPAAAAEQVLVQQRALQSCMQALGTAQEECLQVAKGRVGHAALKKAVDKAYVLACQCTQAREQIQALLQEQLSELHTSRLLQLADDLNRALDKWQQVASEKLWQAMGVNIPVVTTPQQQQQQAVEKPQQQAAGAGVALVGPLGNPTNSYLDLLTGESLPARDPFNPFNSSGGGAAQTQPANGVPPSPPTAAAANQQAAHSQPGPAEAAAGGMSRSGTRVPPHVRAAAAPVLPAAAGVAQAAGGLSVPASRLGPAGAMGPAPVSKYPQVPNPFTHLAPSQHQWQQQQQHLLQHPHFLGQHPQQLAQQQQQQRQVPTHGVSAALLRSSTQPASGAVQPLSRSSTQPGPELQSNGGTSPAASRVAGSTDIPGSMGSTGGALLSHVAAATQHQQQLSQQQQGGYSRTDTGSSDDSTGEAPVPNPFASMDPSPLGSIKKGSGASETIHTTPFDPLAPGDLSEAGLAVYSGGAAGVTGATAGGTAHMGPGGAHGQLAGRIQWMYDDMCRRYSGEGLCCGSCGAPAVQQLLAGFQQLLVQQQQEHERQLQQERAQHQQEVDQIKAMAVKRMKEVMQQQG